MIEVICVNDIFDIEAIKRIPNRPVRDKVYTIRDMFRLPNRKIAVWLNEIENPMLPHENGLGDFEPSFSANRFTKLDGSPLKLERIKAVSLV